MTPGTRLGPYEIVAPIGAGGMGEVYRARDTRLDRQVAVKILPAEFADNAQFKVRFEREAKTISQLSHPNICTLYDVGENYIVMELLDGETLADRAGKGPLPLSDVLKYGVQIAEALGRAHRSGVIHRDLKPGNVMITKSGAKLLDFGLAKGGAPPPSAVHDATVQKPLTAEGYVLGTYQYMAPEQLAGEESDARTDIFSLGCVLYEMVTGHRAFEGKTRTSLIAAILGAEPRPISALQPLTPPSLEHVIRKCLAKDRDDRWQSALDIAEELRWIAEEHPAARARRVAVWPLVAAASALALIIGVIVGVWVVSQRRPVAPIMYSEITPPEGTSFMFETSVAALSPDGRQIAMVAKAPETTWMIWVRSLDSPTARMLKGTDNAIFPFWSPDSRNIGFFADGMLKRIEVQSGIAAILAEASTPRGGAWSPVNTIVYAPTPATPLYIVSAAGGEARPITSLNIDPSQGSHRFPCFLPDGKHFLFFVQGALEHNVLIGSTDPHEPVRKLLTADVAAIFAPPDYVLFVRDRALRAQHLDLKNLKTVGDPVPIAENIQMSTAVNFANMSAAGNGILAYGSGVSSTLSSLVLFDRRGKELGTVGSPMEQFDPRMAPDGHAIVFSKPDTVGTTDIWQYDLKRNVATRLTFSPANEFGPIWSPDSKSIVFSSHDRSPGDIFVKRVDGSGPGEPLVVDRRRKIPSDWTADGRYVVYHALAPGSEWDIEAYSFRDRKTFPLVHGPRAERFGKVSPDAKWLAYTSNESGKEEVYVQGFPTSSERWQVSGGGGTMPLWSRDGRELYYTTPDGKIFAAAIHPGSVFTADAPHLLFSTRMRVSIGVTRHQYDVTPDGRFLVNAALESQRQTPVTLVQNWTAKMGQ